MKKACLTLFIAIICIAIFISCEKGKDVKSTERTEEIKGTWVRYENRYGIFYKGRMIPFELSNGDDYLNSEVNVTVRYMNGGPKFRILNIEILEKSKITPDTPYDPYKDSPEAIQLASRIYSEFSDKRQEMSNLIDGIFEQKVVAEKKYEDWLYMNETVKREETKRIEEIQHAVLYKEIPEIEDWIAFIEVDWESQIVAVRWAINSEKKENLDYRIEQLIAELHAQYDDDIRGLREYFRSLDLD